jgi:hyperosmotically inducible protein
MKKTCLLMICGIILLALCSCTSPVGKTYGVAVDQRSAGTTLSDDEIRLTIEKGLVEESAVDFLDISTFCYQGDVYLVGEYETRKEKTRAVEIARHTPGVKSVTSHLLPRGEKGACGWAEDVQVAGELRVALIGDEDIHSTDIDDKVIHCRVVLLGIVPSKEEIARAVAKARGVTGVRGVTSYLKAAE